jgi:hypothetical protein
MTSMAEKNESEREPRETGFSSVGFIKSANKTLTYGDFWQHNVSSKLFLSLETRLLEEGFDLDRSFEGEAWYSENVSIAEVRKRVVQKFPWAKKYDFYFGYGGYDNECLRSYDLFRVFGLPTDNVYTSAKILPPKSVQRLVMPNFAAMKISHPEVERYEYYEEIGRIILNEFKEFEKSGRLYQIELSPLTDEIAIASGIDLQKRKESQERILKLISEGYETNLQGSSQEDKLYIAELCRRLDAVYGTELCGPPKSANFRCGRIGLRFE